MQRMHSERSDECVFSITQKYLSGPDLVKDCIMSEQYGLQLVCLLG